MGEKRLKRATQQVSLTAAKASEVLCPPLSFQMAYIVVLLQ
jgi:hypothetical protein